MNTAKQNSFLCRFTIPQVINLSQNSKSQLPRAPIFPHRATMFVRLAPMQTGITIVQFTAVRQLRKLLDSIGGPSPLHLSLAYGTASVPLIAAKYNMIVSAVYRYNGHPGPHQEGNAGYSKQLMRFWKRRIQPGLLWSFLRDSFSVGGGIVLGKEVSVKIKSTVVDSLDNQTTESPGMEFGIKFSAGFMSGSICGLATHLFHNAALTAGRMAEGGHVPGNLQCMRQLITEQGWRACYINFPLRVAIIAFWSGVLTVTQPFDYDR